MLEVFYGLYKEQNIRGIIYTIIATSIIYNIGRFRDNSFELDKEVFPKKIARLLRRIRLGKSNRIDFNDILELKKYFLEELAKCGFIAKIPIIGACKSFRFVKFIRRNRNVLNNSIKLFIDKDNINYLEEVDKKILCLRFNFVKYDTFGSFYRDSIDMYNQHFNLIGGNFNLDRYNEYYTISGEKRTIK